MIIQKIIQRYSFFLKPRNILCSFFQIIYTTAMPTHEKRIVRKKSKATGLIIAEKSLPSHIKQH
jgi:hypothetical protein